MLVVYLLAIALVAALHATSYADTPPSGGQPPTQAVAPATQTPAPTAQAVAPAAQAPAPVAPAPADSAQAPAQKTPGPPPSESAEAVKKAEVSLTKEVFSYPADGLLDPFLPFVTPAAAAPAKPPEPDEPEPSLEPEMPRPMTPLQKMSLGEIEKGLKAITWGEMGRRALVEDSAGKGYIISVGTPLGDKSGVVTQIFNDHLVIQQEIWDRESRKMVPQISVVKLWKEKK